MRSRSVLTALAAAVLLGGCGDLFPWHEPAVRAWLSPALPRCPASDTACAVLGPLPRDSALLAALAAPFDVRAGPGRATGMEWRKLESRDGELHVAFGPQPEGETRALYVLEELSSVAAHDSILSISSNGGAVVWLNGRLLGASRAAARPARKYQDIYGVSLPAGRSTLLYRVLATGKDGQLHREWHQATSLPDLLAASIDLGAYAQLARAPILPDSARAVPLWPPQLRLATGPLVRFRWRSLLGDSLATGGSYGAIYPDSLPLPPGFRGMAVLETEVLDGSGARLYYEQCPVFADSTARRLARALAADSTPGDPVREARIGAVRAGFQLRADTSPAFFGDWQKALALAGLYRYQRQPGAFMRYPGPQVWGYRSHDGSVQPYWLTVPPAGPAAVRAGLLYSMTHHVDPDYWAGRGRVAGFLSHLATMASSYGTYGVMPHLAGLTDFDTVAVRELPAITAQVDSVFGIDTAAVGMLVWSSHAHEAAQLALDARVRVSWFGMAVPAMATDQVELRQQLDSLRTLRPGLHWLVWQASGDDRIPRDRTEKWVKQVRRRGFDTRYREVPYSTHLGGYYDDIEAELHRAVAARSRGGAARPRTSLPRGTGGAQQ